MPEHPTAPLTIPLQALLCGWCEIKLSALPDCTYFPKLVSTGRRYHPGGCIAAARLELEHVVPTGTGWGDLEVAVTVTAKG
jgi:hypothetical protein